MERTNKKQTKRTTVTSRENSEMEILQGEVENLRLDWGKIVSENGRVGFDKLRLHKANLDQILKTTH
jgi:hypothetical protein